jgi:hypothetical protein
MPWLSDADSLRHNKLASGKLGEVWRKVANETLERTGDEGLAIREANAVVNRLRKKWCDPLSGGRYSLSGNRS